MPYDGLTPRELTTLSAIQLGQILSQIDADSAQLAEQIAGSEEQLTKAEVRLLFDASDHDAKVQQRICKGVISAAKTRLSALSKRSSRIQTILRTMGAHN